MPKGDIETYHQDGQWKNRREGTERPFAAGGTKAEAIAVGRAAAVEDRVEHIIKYMDGTIAERNSHGNDPRNVPG